MCYERRVGVLGIFATTILWLGPVVLEIVHDFRNLVTRKQEQSTFQ